MKKVMAVVTAFMIIAFSACSVEEDRKEILITSQNSPDGNYTVCLYQVGSPQWSFGSVNAKLVLKDTKGNVIDEENFGLGNDGAGVHTGNLKSITWMENEVEILMDDEGPEEYYVLNYGEK